MSDTAYKRLDFNKTISNETFLQLLKLNTNWNLENLELTQQELKQFLALINVYVLHYDSFETKEQPTFLKAVLEEKFPLFDIPKKFSQYLLENIESSAIVELDKLQNISYNLTEPLDNEEIVDFVELELMDVMESYRKWEYGSFIADTMFQNFFKNIKLTDKKIEKIDKYIETKTSDFDTKEKLLLQLIIQSQQKVENPVKVNHPFRFKMSIANEVVKIDSFVV